MFICNQCKKSIPCKKLVLTFFMICAVFLVIEISLNIHIQPSTENKLKEITENNTVKLVSNKENI